MNPLALALACGALVLILAFLMGSTVLSYLAASRARENDDCDCDK